MPAMYYECSSDEQIRRCLVELAPRTAVVDVEPLIAYWDTGTEELDNGLARFLLEVQSVPSLEAVVFATNSFRRPSNPPQVAGVAYHARALKPFITKTFRHLPRPGVVLGDQTATDGVLAYRLGYTFVRYKPPTETMKLGPKLMAALGVAVRPIFLSQPHLQPPTERRQRGGRRSTDNVRTRGRKNEGAALIRFTDFMTVPEPGLTKVKFNIRAGVGGAEAWDLLLADDPEDRLDMNRHRERHQNNNLDRAQYLLSFAQYYPYGPQYFIFGGFFRVVPVVPELIGGPGYALVPLPQHSEYIKRLIIKLEKPVGRDLYLRWYETLQDSKLNPEVYELAPDTKLGTFPGYQNVRLKHHELQRIIANDEPSWKDALSSVKGVYVITDLSSGRLYVGSASGEANGLWQRWAGYAHLRNLTGGNRELERMRVDLGDEHIVGNFQYSILEIFDPKTKAETILKRESFWKLALDSRAHGMNRN